MAYLWHAFWWSIGIDTANALLEEMGRQDERSSENKTSLSEPLLAMTDSLNLTQNDAVSSLKCDVPTQLYLGGKLPKLYCDY